MPAEQPTVLFLCADNSVRSQMAEALLRRRASDRVEACSAGLEPKPVPQLVADVLREVGIHDGNFEAKPIGPFLRRRNVRYAVILRGADEPDAPRVFPFAARTLQWDVPRPPTSGANALEELRTLRDDIDRRLDELIEVVGADSGRRGT